ncbi:MAG: hypothetical protein JRH08_19290 [Deltaproteobacteria bacterium]|nr:hypothetical protein [Deltaproteobacteria bacterium]MBW1931185.1 hypothetical protein [Deltaproteobacteria bacterium]MBW2027094.1 hypothetical protein [Deltaproteobacteria bacterium]MBW2127720.1 hypothetical protein [Deltaproteobacteria bacterium]
MKKLSGKGQMWLKGFHIFFACLWIGAAVCLTLMNIFLKAGDGKVLYGINLSMKFIDDFIIIPGAMGSLLTGLIYSIFTGWGWFKHNWVIIKWVINIFGVIFGTFWLGQWVNGLVPISAAQGIGALSNQTYMHNKNMVLIWGTFQLCTLIFAVFISILKPWRRSRR